MSLFAVTVNRIITNSTAAATDIIYALCINPNDDKSHACLSHPKIPSPACIRPLTAAWQK